MVNGHLLLGAGWTLFCVLHSLLAASSIKRSIEARYPRVYTYYRLFYTVFAAVTFIALVLYQIQLQSPLLFLPVHLTLYAGWILAGIGAFIMLLCIKKYFLSLSGVKSLVANKVVSNTLRIDGIHRYVRHPLYVGTFLFIWGMLLAYPHLSLLLSNVIITGYTLYGIVLEERKLIEEFGADYIQYRATVPALIPFTRR